MKTASCPECDADIEVPDNAQITERLGCDECGEDLAVKSLDPLELETYEDDEDFDDDEDEDEDEF